MTNPLFEAVDLGVCSLKNRIAMAPMTRNMSPDFVLSVKACEYYTKRAQADVGLIITEACLVDHPSANCYENVPGFYGASLKEWLNVVESVQAHGCRIIPQLMHAGRVRKSTLGPEVGYTSHSPSALAGDSEACIQALTEQDIQDIVRAFAHSAMAANRLGFDGVEIHGAHGYLIDQFLWQETNQRQDRYGGSISARSRFAAEIIKAVKAEMDSDKIVSFRLSQWKQQDYNAKLVSTPEELEALLKPLVDAGVNVFHASTRRFWLPEFEGSDLNLAGWIKKITGLPVITVGSVGIEGDDFTSLLSSTSINESRFDQLVAGIDNQDYDVVAVGRALLADERWAVKLKNSDFSNMTAYNRKHLMSYP